MNTATMEKTVVTTRSGQTLTIAQGTEATATYGEKNLKDVNCGILMNEIVITAAKQSCLVK